MNYGIIVSNYTEASETAIAFIHALATAGHKTQRVFFYSDGVLNAANDRPSATQKKWQDLSVDLKIELDVCITAATKRGLISTDNSTSHNLIADQFEVSGLGQMADLAMHCDRVITFR